MLAIADRVAAHVKGPYVDHGAFLYDEHGLPK
jgi:antitoxin VapB